MASHSATASKSHLLRGAAKVGGWVEGSGRGRGAGRAKFPAGSWRPVSIVLLHTQVGA